MVHKPFDIILSALSLFIIALFIQRTLASNEDSSFISVKIDKKNYIYPIEEDRTLKFQSIIGETTIVINDKKAAIIDSPCKNKTCVEMGNIYKPGQSSACLPNRVMVTVEGEDREVDIISY